MPAVKTTAPPTTALPGTGGRGPRHNLPTGGGGEGDWRSQPPGGRGPRERLLRARVALAVLMSTSVALFATVAIGYLWRKGQFVFDRTAHTYVSVWKPISIPPLLWWNTLLLVLSSLAIECARRQYFREDLVMDEWLGFARPTVRRALPWQFLSLLLAIGFLVGQIQAWGELQRQGIFLGSGPSSQFYYFLTGLHGLHLLGGMVVLVWSMVATLVGLRLESRRVTLDITAWYWHAITVVWFGLFALLEICK